MTILSTVYYSITDTDTWDFIKTCDPDDYSERPLQLIAWECGKRGLDCSGEEWHIAMDHMKYIAWYGWDNYIVNYK
jgi:hypothetical protein